MPSAIKMQRFISLKWKTAFTLLILLGSLIGALSWYYMQRFHEQLDRELNRQRALHGNTIEHSVHRSGESLYQVIDNLILKRAVSTRSVSRDALLNDLETKIKTHFSDLNYHWMIDEVVITDENYASIFQKVANDSAGPWLADWLATLNDNKKLTTVSVQCNSAGCQQLFSFPIFHRNAQLGSVILKRPFSKILQEVSATHTIQLGVLFPHSDLKRIGGEDSDSTYNYWADIKSFPHWNADLHTSLLSSDSISVLENASTLYAIETLLGSAFAIENAGKYFSITALPMRGFNPDKARYIVVSNVTSIREEMLNNIFQQLVIISAIACVFLVYLLVLSWRQFDRIKQQLKIFPLIGDKQFKDAREVVLQHRSKTLYRDELDLLDDVVTSLTYQLESLEKAVSLRNREMERLSLFDTLTGLANRNLFQYELQSDVMTFESQGGMLAAVILDLDNFRRINDTIGHQQGDMLLGKVGTRLKNATKSFGLIARLGGDEFAIILRSAKMVSHIELLSQKILELVHKPIDLDGHSVVISCSLGVALATQGQDADELIKNAEIAMYTAKSGGGNSYRIFDQAMAREAHANLSLETDIRRAFRDKEFTLFLQPKVNMDSTIEGFEALIRWDHPDRGMVPPIEFIPVMENLGMIAELDNFVLDASCRQLHLLQRHYPNISIAVNISSTHFTDTNFIEFLKECLSKYPIDPSLLELEITETLLMENMSTGMEVIQSIKEMGVSIAIDDFGTGYSSLSYLKKLPVDTIKIDREFIKDIPDSESDMQISSVIIFLAKQLDFKVVAEGVETKEQLVFLKANHCDLAQGFLFSKPVPAHKAILLLETQRGNLKQQRVS